MPDLTPDRIGEAKALSFDARRHGYFETADTIDALLAERETLREALRLRMIEAGRHTTEDRDTYADGFFNGLAAALDEFDRTPALAAPTEGDTFESHPGVDQCTAQRVHPLSSDYKVRCQLAAGHAADHVNDGCNWTDASAYALPPEGDTDA